MGYEAPILVGLDGSEAAAAALRWAAWQSSRTTAPVVAVHAYSGDPDLRDRADGRKTEENVVRARATQWIRNALADSSTVPGRTQLVVVEGSPAEVLKERSAEAGMLVVGASGAAAPGTARGHLSAALRVGSSCPVVIVPSSRQGASSPAVTRPLVNRPSRAPAGVRGGTARR